MERLEHEPGHPDICSAAGASDPADSCRPPHRLHCRSPRRGPPPCSLRGRLRFETAVHAHLESLVIPLGHLSHHVWMYNVLSSSRQAGELPRPLPFPWPVTQSLVVVVDGYRRFLRVISSPLTSTWRRSVDPHRHYLSASTSTTLPGARAHRSAHLLRSGTVPSQMLLT